MKQSFFSIITFILFSFVLTACNGGSSGGSTGKASVPNTDNPDTTTTPPAGVNFVIGDPKDPPEFTIPATEEYTDMQKVDDADDGETKALYGLAVFADIGTVATIESPAVQLTFGANNVITGITAHVNDTYTASDTGNTDKYTFTGTTENGANINLNRGIAFFGFNSDYMTQLNWSESTNITGMMIAGVETSNTDIVDISDISFTGKGSGIYRNSTETYNTVFDVHATVDATNNNDVTIFTSNTCKAAAGSECGVGGADRVDMLNLDPVTAGYADNSITSSSASAGTLAGNINARFYGSDISEFGGAFVLVDATSYYYGTFGAKLLGATYGSYSVVSDIYSGDDSDCND